MAKVLQTGWRAAEVLQGDTLQSIAARELGDATSWPQIAWLNNLLPPFLTGNSADPRVADGRLVLYGSRIKVPSANSTRVGVTPAEAFGVDLSLTNGALRASASGDFEIKSGVDNLDQALNLRLTNARGDLMFYPRYGNGAWALIGRKLTPGSAQIIRRYCQETVIADPRVKRVSGATAKAVGDAADVALTAQIDGGSPLRLQITL